MDIFPKKLQKHFYPQDIWVRKYNLDKLSFSMRNWILTFFSFCINNHKSFYWDFDKFKIIIRRKTPTNIRLFIEVLIPYKPFLVQHQFNISHLQPTSLLRILVELYDSYPSSSLCGRNRQSSVRFLSFFSYISLVYNNEIIPTLPKLVSLTPDENTIVQLLFMLLDSVNISHRNYCSIQQSKVFSLIQLKHLFQQSKCTVRSKLSCH